MRISCISRNYLLCLLYIFLVLSLQSLSYDIYAHAIIYKFQFNTHSYNINDFFYLPRYFLLSVIYATLSFLRFPLGIFITLALSVLLNLSIKSKYYKKLSNLKKTLFILLFTILSYFYSASSLAIIVFTTYLTTKKKYLLVLSALIAPFGAFLSAVYFLWALIALFIKRVTLVVFKPSSRLKFGLHEILKIISYSVFTILCFFAIIYMGQVLNLANNYNAKYYVNFATPELLNLLFSRSVEASLILIGIPALIAVKYLNKLFEIDRLNVIKIPVLAPFFLVVIVLQFAFVMLERCTPLYVFLTKTKPPATLNITWLPVRASNRDSVHSLMKKRDYCK